MADFQTRPIVTNAARAAISSMINTGSPAIQISAFSVGTGGYSPVNPSVAQPPSSSATALQNEIFRSQSVSRVNVDQFTLAYVCQLNPGDAIGALGEVGLWATYLTGSLQGQVFLFAYANFPMKSCTADDEMIFKLPIVI